MPQLYDKTSGALLGNVSDADVQLLIDRLEEEHREDRDYYIDAATVDILQESGASAELIAMLRKALGDSEGIEVRYER